MQRLHTRFFRDFLNFRAKIKRSTFFSGISRRSQKGERLAGLGDYSGPRKPLSIFTRAVDRILDRKRKILCKSMTTSAVEEMEGKLRFIDIGSNLVDGMFTRGEYHGKVYHAGDLDAVLSRARLAGLEKIIVTAGNLEEAQSALDLCQQHENLYCTAGVHPTRANEWAQHEEGPEAYLEKLSKIIEIGKNQGKLVAVGECGLDYDRLQFSDIETQKKCFEAHFMLTQRHCLPMFLHSRAAGEDFYNIISMQGKKGMPRGGVVHSFDGSIEEAKAIIALEGMFIGLNGCSLKTEENLKVAKEIPLGTIMLETDAPWCGIRPSHASSSYILTQIIAKDKKKHSHECQVKGRNEPANIVQVCEVIAGIKGVSAKDVADAAYETALRVFF